MQAGSSSELTNTRSALDEGVLEWNGYGSITFFFANPFHIARATVVYYIQPETSAGLPQIGITSLCPIANRTENISGLYNVSASKSECGTQGRGDTAQQRLQMTFNVSDYTSFKFFILSKVKFYACSEYIKFIP